MTPAIPVARTNYIFIDFENVHETDWARIVGKPVKAKLILGEQNKYIPIAVVKNLIKCAAQVELIETKQTGKGAADIVLADHVGEQSKEDPHGYFHIVSGDKGFDALISHLKGHGILAARRASFSDIPVLMHVAERVERLAAFFKNNPLNHPKKRQSLESQIQAVFGKALSPEDVAATVQGLVAAKVIELSATGEVVYRTTKTSSAPASKTTPSKPPMSSSARTRTN